MALDVKPYNEEKKFETWENCTLRAWLNASFYNVAFTDKEKSIVTETKATNISGDGVLDKVSILSNIDACNASYGFNYDSVKSETRLAQITAYAKANGAFSYKENGCWWLRPYDETRKEIYDINAVGELGEYDNEYISTTTTVVRPCVHINLLSDAWSKADTITATGGSFVTPTPTATTTPTATPDNGQNNIPTSSPEPSIQPEESPKVTNEPKTVTVPAKVKGLSAKNKKKKSVTLSWKKVKGATGYQIQYTSDAFAKKKVKNTKKTKVIIKKLKKKKTYSFRVRAYKINSGVKFCGSWCKAKKVKMKK